MLPLAVAMCLPAIADVAADNPDWQVFLTAAVFTLFVGGTLALSSRGNIRTITPRQGFVLTTTLWLVIPAFAALPFAFADMDLSYTDAFFESMSGLTTTGSTVIRSLDVAPLGCLFGVLCCNGWAVSASSPWRSRSCRCCGSAVCSSSEWNRPTGPKKQCRVQPNWSHISLSYTWRRASFARLPIGRRACGVSMRLPMP